MPFGTCTWTKGTPQFDWAAQPQPVLQHLDGKWFRLLQSFAYRPPERDPDHDCVFVIPGADAPTSTQTQTKKLQVDGLPVVIPPNPKDGKTDIASVPWVFWWLVASYGNHTRAALLHDALVVDNGPPPVPRTEADRLFLAALREPEAEKTGVFRHWLMWAAVAAFGTMNKYLRIPFALHVLAVWGLVSAGFAWAWGPELWPSFWVWDVAVVAGAIVGTFLLLTLLGTLWRAGVDHTGGWLSPTAAFAGAFVVLFSVTGSDAFGVSPKGFFVLAAALTLIGFAWGRVVDRTLRWWLWPTVLLGLPIALLPVMLILIAVALVGALDVGAQIAKVFAGEKFKWPSPAPHRLPL